MTFQSGDGPRVEARCRDISLGGVFVETGSPLPYGAEVRLFIALPGLIQGPGIAGVVRWSKPTGMGVQFGVMGARETHALATLLSRASLPGV